MATFQAQVQSYVGTVTDTDALTSWLTAGARFIVDILPRHIFDEYASSISVTTAGLAIDGYRIQDVIKSGYDATRVPVGMRAAVQDENSIHFALAASPVSVIYNKKIYVYPNGGEILAMAYPTVTYGLSSITAFPDRMEHAVVLYTAIQCAIAKASASIVASDALTAPTAPSDPAITFVDASGGTITLPSVPTYTKPTTTFSATNISTYIGTDEDLDKAREEINHQKSLLELYQMDLYNELNEYNKDLEVYKAEFEKAVQDTRRAYEADVVTRTKDFEALVADYQAQISKYQASTNAYASQVSAEVNMSQGYFLLADKLKAELTEFINGSVRSNG